MFKYIVEYYQGTRIVKQVELWASDEKDAEWKAARIYGELYPDPADNARWIVLGIIEAKNKYERAEEWGWVVRSE